MKQILYTIGHSNSTSEKLISLLQQHLITAVADVRSQPYSHFSPQFNREELSLALKSSQIKYVFLGQELGARSNDPGCYRDGRAQYTLMAKTPLFERGIERLLGGMEDFRVAIMCAEKEPLQCHRTILISRYLHERGISVKHILENGGVEDHDALLLRLLAAHGMQENNLFLTKDELIAQAYKMQAEEIQYSASDIQQPA